MEGGGVGGGGGLGLYKHMGVSLQAWVCRISEKGGGGVRLTVKY